MPKRQCVGCDKPLDQLVDITADSITADTITTTTFVTDEYVTTTHTSDDINVGDGTIAAPSIHSQSYATTGLSWPSSNTLSVSNSGGESIRFTSSMITSYRSFLVQSDSSQAARIAQSASNIGFTFSTSSGVNAAQMFANGNSHNILTFRNGSGTTGLSRWGIQLANTESGSNVGSDFRINRYDDTGTFLGTAFILNRATGIGTFSSALLLSPNVPASTTNSAYNDSGNFYWDGYKLNNDSVMSSVSIGTLDLANDIVRSTAAQTITLPLAANSPGKTYTVLNTAAHNTDIQRSGSDTIDDGSTTTITLTTAYEHVTLKSDGIALWMVI